MPVQSYIEISPGCRLESGVTITHLILSDRRLLITLSVQVRVTHRGHDEWREFHCFDLSQRYVAQLVAYTVIIAHACDACITNLYSKSK